MIRTSLLDAVEHDLNVGGCEFFEFQLSDGGNDVLLDNARNVARIAVTFFNDIYQPVFGERFYRCRVILFKFFFLSKVFQSSDHLYQLFARDDLLELMSGV